jgi:hypothetical protein
MFNENLNSFKHNLTYILLNTRPSAWFSMENRV